MRSVKNYNRECECISCQKLLLVDDLGACPKCYRKAYQKWLNAKKRGHYPSIGDYLLNPDKRIKLSKITLSRKYHYKKQVFDRALAMPKWINIEQLATIYSECPAGMHVDHIIPIKGKNVCGLEVPWNLQYLSPTANYKKGNKH